MARNQKNLRYEVRNWGIIIILLILLGNLFPKKLNSESKRFEALKRRRLALNFTNHNYRPDDYTDNLSKLTDRIQGFFISQNLGHTSIDSVESLDKKGGFFRDLTGDGKKEWIYQKYYLGASGYSDTYEVFQRNGLNLKLIWSGDFREDKIEFNDREIKVVEPVWEETECHACSSAQKISVYRWNGERFELSNSEVVDAVKILRI